MLRRFAWNGLTVAGGLVLGACLIGSGRIIASERAACHRARQHDAHDKAIALGLDRYLTETLYAALPADQRTARDAIDTRAHAVSPGQR